MLPFLCPSYGTFKNLVSFAAIQPHTAPPWAVVNLHTLALSHEELSAVNRTIHVLTSPVLFVLSIKA